MSHRLAALDTHTLLSEKIQTTLSHGVSALGNQPRRLESAFARCSDRWKNSSVEYVLPVKLHVNGLRLLDGGCRPYSSEHMNSASGIESGGSVFDRPSGTRSTSQEVGQCTHPWEAAAPMTEDRKPFWPVFKQSQPTICSTSEALRLFHKLRLSVRIMITRKFPVLRARLANGYQASERVDDF